jgi:hypothetical protein
MATHFLPNVILFLSNTELSVLQFVFSRMKDVKLVFALNLVKDHLAYFAY